MKVEDFEEIAAVVEGAAENLQGAMAAAKALGVTVTLALEAKVTPGVKGADVVLQVTCAAPRDVLTAIRI